MHTFKTSKRKSVLALIFTLLAFTSCTTNNTTITPESSTYIIDSFSSKAILSEQNTVSTSETIIVDFFEPEASFTRAFPLTVTLEKMVDGKPVSLNYTAHVSSVFVDGYTFTAETRDNIYYITITSGDTAFEGKVAFHISYIYDLGDDRIDAYDDTYFSFLGSGFDVPVKKMDFLFTFPKTSNLSDISVFSGTWGALSGIDNITYTTEGQTVQGGTTAIISAQQTIILYAKLPAGYFSNTRTATLWPLYVSAIAVVLLLVFALLLAAKLRSPYHARKVTQIAAPPENITAPDAGYLLDHHINDKEIQALVLWLAQNKYLSITVTANGDYTLHNEKPVEKEQPAYIKHFMQNIFEKADTITLSADASSLQSAVQTCKTELLDEFSGYKSLEKKSVRSFAFAMAILCAVPAGLFIAFAGVGIQPISYILGAAFAVSLVLFGFTVWRAKSTWNTITISAKTKKTVLSILFLALCVGVLFLCYQYVSEYVPFALTLNIGLASILSTVLFATLSKPTDYAANNTLQLQGLKAFMKDVEMPRLKEITKETPDYFYELLSYAYAFGTAIQWVKKFDLLPATQPTWYQDDRTDPAKTPRSILNTLTALLKQYFVSETTKSSKKETATTPPPLPENTSASLDNFSTDAPLPSDMLATEEPPANTPENSPTEVIVLSDDMDSPPDETNAPEETNEDEKQGE